MIAADWLETIPDGVLARTDEGVGLWVACTGPTPTKVLGVYQSQELQLIKAL